MRKKILGSISSLAIIILPLLTVSCSTTWMNWKPLEDTPTNFEFDENEISKEIDKYKVREKDVLMQAYNKDNQIIDLDKINNHYEFIHLITYITNTKIIPPIKESWKQESWDNLHNKSNTGFFDLIEPKSKFSLKIADNSDIISYDLETPLKDINSGFDDFEKDGSIKAFDVEKNGLDSTGMPNDLALITPIGAPMLSIGIIKSLLQYKPSLAFSLSTLVNLPKKSFDNFLKLLETLDKWTTQMFSSKSFESWIKIKNVNFKLDANGAEIKHEKELLNLFQGKYIYHILSNDKDIEDEKPVDPQKPDPEGDKDNKKTEVIDLTKHINVKSMLNEVNQHLNIFMPQLATEFVKLETKLGPKFISEKSFNNLKSYTSGINKSNLRFIEFQFNGEKYTWDLNPIMTQIKIIQEKLALGYDKTMLLEYKNKKMTEAIGGVIPNMAAITNKILGRILSLQLTSFMAIPSEGYENYLNMLDGYHDFTWNFTQSNIYKKWVQENKSPNFYSLVKNDSSYNVAPGEEFDDPEMEREFNSLWRLLDPKPKFPKELNNLEAQLVLSILNIYQLIK